jgi:hypothetical protein
MRIRPEERYQVEFPVFLSFQAGNGGSQRVSGRCVDLSPSGAKLETIDKLAIRSHVLVQSEEFGRMGVASVRYCVRQGMKYEVGLQFSTSFGLSDPMRKKALNRVLKREG